MENSVLSTNKSWDLDKICRVCLVQKKDMRPLFGELVVDMLMDVARVAIVNTDGWPDKICVQCVHQVSRCHAFKMRVEKSDQELRNYIKSLTVIVEEPVIEIPPQQQQQQQQQQHVQHQQLQQQQQQQRLTHSQNILSGRSPQLKTSPQHQHHQQLNTNTSVTPPNNPTRQLQTQTITTELPSHHHQQVVLSNGQLHNAQIINAAQLMTHNGTPITQIVNANQLSQLIQTGNTVQMIQQNGQSAQVVQIQRSSDDHCEIIVHPDDDTQYFEDVTEQLQHENDNNDCIQNTENIIHMHDDGELEMEEEDDQTHISGEELTFELINSNSEEEVVESTEEEEDDKEYITEFINLQTTYIAPGRYSCNLCRKEFKQNKWLQNHMKSHSNWIKANCKKQPQCEICHRSFKGPGMLRMHMKTHEIVDKTPTCTICKKTFKSKTILYRHRQTHQQKSYQCGNCNKHFSSPYTLNSHMTKKHILERFKFKCAQCEEIFYVVELLKVHMQNTGHNGKSFKSEDSS